MQLTPGERKRLRTLLACHRKPPTYASLLPRGAAVFAAGAGSPLMYYCLGLASFFPILALNLIVTSVRRWRINEAITNWERVEELLSRANRPRE